MVRCTDGFFRAAAVRSVLAGVLAAAMTPVVTAQTVTAIPGFTGPEDLEFVPKTHLMIVSNFYRYHGQKPGGLALLDLETEKVRWLPITNAYEKGWGADSCTTALEHIGPHGINLARRRDGRLELWVVNHQERQSIETLEIKMLADGPHGIWHGCVTNANNFNDVAGMADGGFIASVPVDQAVLTAHGGKAANDGSISGYMVEWRPGGNLKELPNTEAPYTNGVQISADERTMYFNAWTAREVRRYDLKTGTETGRIKLDFMPDNLSWRADGKLLATGVTEIGDLPNCPLVDGDCAHGFGVAALDLKSFTATDIYKAGPGVIPGASEALQQGNTLYIGGFLGERVVKIDLSAGAAGRSGAGTR
jgi:hypothetical protein